MDSSDRLLLPFLSPGQAQKETYHNEALQILDTLVAAAVEGPPQNDPPSNPVEGTCFIIGAAPSADWSANAGAVAAYSSAGWRFVAPVEGMVVWVKSTAVFATYAAGAWEVGQVRGSELLIDGVQVVGAQAAAIPDPTGGTTIDTEARATVAWILSVLRQHGLIAAV